MSKKSAPLTWSTTKRIAKELIPNASNPRVISEKMIELLKKSIQTYNIVELVVIDTDDRVLVGHQRLAILKMLGRENEEIEVRIPSRKLSQKEYDEYLLMSNRIHGEFDIQKLLENFDMETLFEAGFDDSDLSHIFDEQLEIEEDGFNVEKALEEIKVPISQTGDIYKLGDQIVACGDSNDLAFMQKVVGDRKVQMVTADSPYNIQYDYVKGFGGGNKNYQGDVDDNLSDADYRKFLYTSVKNAISFVDKDAHVFYFSDPRYIGMVQSIYAELGIESKRVCLWIKAGAFNPTPSSAFNRAYEPATYGTIGKPFISDNLKNISEIMNKEVGSGNQAHDDILDMLDIWICKRVPTGEYVHATQKPVTLYEKSLRRCSKPGDTILDPFAGSGTTLLACEQLKRKCITVDMNPIFVDIVIRRWEEYTKQKAVKIS